MCAGEARGSVTVVPDVIGGGRPADAWSVFPGEEIRTATGKVSTSDAPDYTQAVFEAYAGSTKVGAAQTRTVSRYAVYKDFSFVAGDPDLVGGIDRIKVTLCVYVLSGKHCGTPYQAWWPQA